MPCARKWERDGMDETLMQSGGIGSEPAEHGCITRAETKDTLTVLNAVRRVSKVTAAI